MPAATSPAAETVAEEFLVHLRRRGVGRLFVNAGTDFAPLVEAYARHKESGLDLPQVIVCAHENLAVSMAHGSYLGDGRIQAVMLHTSVGTANAICAVINATRSRVPILVSAGRTPLFEHSVLGSRDAPIHWAQEMYDQAGMLREVVKWDYELRDGAHVHAVVDRALTLARAEPPGPVYLTLPREVLAAPVFGDEPEPAPAPSNEPHPSPEAVAALAEKLSAARLPVIVTGDSGADPGTVEALGALCGEHAIGVVEHGARHLNLPADHPMHLGYRLDDVLAEADVLCALDLDVPWLGTGPPPSTVVAQCGPDPHFMRYPMRTHRSDLSITTSVAALLPALNAALRERSARMDAGRAARIAERGAGWRSRRESELEREKGAEGAITKTFLNYALAQVRPQDAVVVNEYWASPEVLAGTVAGSYFGTPPAGGLGWGLPAAMGVQLARPNATVIATVGDGAYLFANPAACHQAMAMHDLPVLTLVCGNGHWGAVQRAALRMYPHGQSAAVPDLSPLARLDPSPAFEAYPKASGGHGERVSRREDLIPALRRALAVVRDERRQALVSVDCV